MTDSPARSTEVGIIAPDRPEGGLFRDAETICWALSGIRGLSSSVIKVRENLYTKDYAACTNETLELVHPSNCARLPVKLTMTDWLAKLDCVVILEALNPSLLDLVFRSPKTKRILYIPNLEWATLDPYADDTKPWIKQLRSYGQRVVCVARSESIQRRLAENGITSDLLRWSIPDAVRTRDHSLRRPAHPIRVLYNAGNHGFRDRRGSDIVANALGQWPHSFPKLKVFIKSNEPHSALDAVPSRANLEIKSSRGFLQSRDKIMELYDKADVVLYPSRFEGFGLGLLEALHRGCYVLATRGDPMQDMLDPASLRIDAKLTGHVRLAPSYEPNPASLIDALGKIACNPELLRSQQSGHLKSRQEDFCDNLLRLVRHG